MQFGQKQVSYMGHIISSEGFGADPKKLKAIDEMAPPSDKASFQSVLGMVNYVQKFTPNPANLTKSLREIDKKENEFVRKEEIHGKCLERVKRVLTHAPVLKFFNTSMRCIHEWSRGLSPTRRVPCCLCF